jgi:hypothetical protein
MEDRLLVFAGIVAAGVIVLALFLGWMDRKGVPGSDEITGFYSDANGVFHGFVATAIPEPSSLALLGIGASAILV